MKFKDTLYGLDIGQNAIVERITIEPHIKRRLMDLGMLKGTKVECVGISPLGDPKAFLIRGSVIALRREESSKINISVLE